MSAYSNFYKIRTLNQILWDGVKLYQKYWIALTLPLLSPYLKIISGVVLWLVLPIGTFNITQNWNQPGLMALLFIASNIPGAWLFFGGFWRYLLFLSAQSQMVRDLIDHGHIENTEAAIFKVSCRGNDYAMLCVVLMFMWLLPFVLFLLTTALTTSATQNIGIAIFMGTITLLATAFIVMVVTLFLSLSFQCFMFQPDKLGAVLWHSFELVRKQFWKVLLVGFISFMATQNVLPTLITCILDWLRITKLLSQPLLPGVHYYIQHVSESFAPNAALTYLAQHQDVIAGSIVEVTLMLSFAMLLIPLGACWYTLLYADLTERTTKWQTPTLPPMAEVS